MQDTLFKPTYQQFLKVCALELCFIQATGLLIVTLCDNALVSMVGGWRLITISIYDTPMILLIKYPMFCSDCRGAQGASKVGYTGGQTSRACQEDPRPRRWRWLWWRNGKIWTGEQYILLPFNCSPVYVIIKHILIFDQDFFFEYLKSRLFCLFKFKSWCF